MSLNGYKYRAEIFKIMGLSLITPLGRLVINLLEGGFRNLTNSFYVDLTGSVILLAIGICFIQRGYEIAVEGEEK